MKTKYISPSYVSTASYRGSDEAPSVSGFSAQKHWRELQLHLATAPAGRIVLHLLCFACAGRVRWHARGLGRELVIILSEFSTWLMKPAGLAAAQTPGLAFRLEHPPTTQTSL